MNYRNIRKYFDFFCGYGFKRKQISNGIDYEIYYQKNDIEIGVMCTMGVPTESLKVYIKDGYYNFPVGYDVDKVLGNANYGVDVVITKGGKRNNIFECELFNNYLLNELKSNVLNSKSDVNKLFEIYSVFLKENIFHFI